MREEIREKIEEKRCGRAAIDLKKAPLCKGSSAAGGEGLFFLQPFHHFVVPLPLHRGGAFKPLSARPASVLRTLANPSNRCAVSEPVSATPASMLRILANPFTQGSLKTLYKLPDN